MPHSFYEGKEPDQVAATPIPLDRAVLGLKDQPEQTDLQQAVLIAGRRTKPLADINADDLDEHNAYLIAAAEADAVMAALLGEALEDLQQRFGDDFNAALTGLQLGWHMSADTHLAEDVLLRWVNLPPSKRDEYQAAICRYLPFIYNWMTETDTGPFGGGCT